MKMVTYPNSSTYFADFKISYWKNFEKIVDLGLISITFTDKNYFAVLVTEFLHTMTM